MLSPYQSLPHSPHFFCNCLHFFTLLDSGHPPSNPIFSVSSTCFFQVFFGHLRFLLPLTLRCRTTLKTLSSSLLSTCPYHLTPFAVASRSIVFLNLFSFNFCLKCSVIYTRETGHISKSLKPQENDKEPHAAPQPRIADKLEHRRVPTRFRVSSSSVTGVFITASAAMHEKIL